MLYVIKQGEVIFLGKDGWESKNRGQETQGSKISKDKAKYTKLHGVRGMWEME